MGHNAVKTPWTHPSTRSPFYFSSLATLTRRSSVLVILRQNKKAPRVTSITQSGGWGCGARESWQFMPRRSSHKLSLSHLAHGDKRWKLPHPARPPAHSRMSKVRLVMCGWLPIAITRTRHSCLHNFFPGAPFVSLRSALWVSVLIFSALETPARLLNLCCD